MRLKEVLNLRKAKYQKRWKGKDGKWHYTYETSINKKKKETRKEEFERKMTGAMTRSDIQWVKDNYKKFKKKLTSTQRKKVESAMKDGQWKKAKKILVPKAWGLDKMKAKAKTNEKKKNLLAEI